MPDFRRQRDAARTERDELRRELENLQAVVGWIDPAYAAALRDHAELAAVGIRSEQAGSRGIPESRPPKYDARAYDDLRKQRVTQRREASYLRARHAFLVDPVHNADPSRKKPATQDPRPNGMPTPVPIRGENKTA